MPTTSAFSFLTKPNSAPATTQVPPTFPSLNFAGNGSPKIPENGLSSLVSTTQASKAIELKEKPQEKDKIFKKSTDYFAKLKGLNESVSQWIKSHVDSNPFCILTPIFRDYERYLKEIEAQHGDESSKTTEQVAKNTLNSITSDKIIQPTVEIESKEPKKSIFANKTPAAQSIFSHTIFNNTKKDENEVKLDTKAASFPQTVPSTFSFGPSSTTSVTSASFSFGGGKPFTFGTSVVSSQNSETKDDNEDDDEPPKPEIKAVTEEGAIYEKRCKVFVKKDGTFGDRGVGVLFLKPTPNGKTQLIVRAQTALGNLLLNTLLTESIPTKRMNKNTVMLMCLPLPDSQPPPASILLRVKTSEDADSLLEALESNKK